MTFHEKLVEKYVERALEQWDNNPLAMSFLRRLANEVPAIFFASAMRRLRSNEVSNAHRFLAILALRHEQLMPYLANPANASRDTAVKLLRRFLEVDPSFDVKLAHELPNRGHTNHARAFDAVRSTRALDILDATSRGRRLLPILGHLPNAEDHRVAAKATLFVGRRVQSPAWSSRHLGSPDQRVRANAVEAIWGLDTQPAMQLLETCASDTNNRVMGNALVGLHIAGHRSVADDLLSLARSGSPDHRSTAAWAMGQLAGDCWIDALATMIKDDHPQVRSMALRSMAQIRRCEQRAAAAERRAIGGVPDIEASVTVPESRPEGSTYEAFPQYRYIG